MRLDKNFIRLNSIDKNLSKNNEFDINKLMALNKKDTQIKKENIPDLSYYILNKINGGNK